MVTKFRTNCVSDTLKRWYRWFLLRKTSLWRVSNETGFNDTRNHSKEIYLCMFFDAVSQTLFSFLLLWNIFVAKSYEFARRDTKVKTISCRTLPDDRRTDCRARPVITRDETFVSKFFFSRKIFLLTLVFWNFEIWNFFQTNFLFCPFFQHKMHNACVFNIKSFLVRYETRVSLSLSKSNIKTIRGSLAM